jgi:hypothetical protein
MLNVIHRFRGVDSLAFLLALWGAMVGHGTCVAQGSNSSARAITFTVEGQIQFELSPRIQAVNNIEKASFRLSRSNAWWAMEIREKRSTRWLHHNGNTLVELIRGDLPGQPGMVVVSTRNSPRNERVSLFEKPLWLAYFSDGLFPRGEGGDLPLIFLQGERFGKAASSWELTAGGLPKWIRFMYEPRRWDPNPFKDLKAESEIRVELTTPLWCSYIVQGLSGAAAMEVPAMFELRVFDPEAEFKTLQPREMSVTRGLSERISAPPDIPLLREAVEGAAQVSDLRGPSPRFYWITNEPVPNFEDAVNRSWKAYFRRLKEEEKQNR